MSFYDVIDNKVVDYCEIVTCLFEHCNLNCIFCPQDHNSIVGSSRKEILAKAQTISHYINNNTRSVDFSVHIMGGELFSDYWLQKDYLLIYEKFIRLIRKNVKEDKNVIFNFVTNLVFERHHLVRDFLDRNGLKISISYDPHGRFNSYNNTLFKQNVERFKDRIRMVSCVQTLQNIKAIKHGDEYFDYLYSLFPVDWDHLLPSTGKKSDLAIMPRESEVLKFYKILIDKYPKCRNIEHFTNGKSENKMTCTRGNSLTIMPDGTIPKGCSGSVLLKEYNTEDLGGTKIMENWVDKYNCFECQYFKRCPMSCFIKSDFKHLEDDLPDCAFRMAFKYADEKIKHSIR